MVRMGRVRSENHGRNQTHMILLLFILLLLQKSAVFWRIVAVETTNSLENFSRIQLIHGKFSREFRG